MTEPSGAGDSDDSDDSGGDDHRADDLHELALEATIGGLGVDADRTVPVISLANLEQRRAEITDQLWSAASDTGFFQLGDHGIPAEIVDRAFGAAEAFFNLPDSAKAAYPWKRELNAGWESRAQVRPSTKVADQKESYQLTRPHMDGLWPAEDEVPGFADDLLRLESAAWDLAMFVLSCFADRLGFDRRFFDQAHAPDGEGYQSTLRLLHYFPMTADQTLAGQWRAGAHTDYDCLTLLFQQDGQDGLQLCPGRDAESGSWTSVKADRRLITCNIGDMLTRWSDDQLRSTLHRVRGPRPGEVATDRYSVAFFAQANKPTVIESPSGRGDAITANEFLQRRINANFDA